MTKNGVRDVAQNLLKQPNMVIFYAYLSNNVSKCFDPKKTRHLKKKKFHGFWAPCPPPRATRISGSRAFIKKTLNESANLAKSSLHAKFQPNSTIRLARAMGHVSIFAISFYNWKMSVTVSYRTRGELYRKNVHDIS